MMKAAHDATLISSRLSPWCNLLAPNNDVAMTEVILEENLFDSLPSSKDSAISVLSVAVQLINLCPAFKSTCLL